MDWEGGAAHRVRQTQTPLNSREKRRKVRGFSGKNGRNFYQAPVLFDHRREECREGRLASFREGNEKRKESLNIFKSLLKLSGGKKTVLCQGDTRGGHGRKGPPQQKVGLIL